MRAVCVLLYEGGTPADVCGGRLGEGVEEVAPLETHAFKVRPGLRGIGDARGAGITGVECGPDRGRGSYCSDLGELEAVSSWASVRADMVVVVISASGMGESVQSPGSDMGSSAQSQKLCALLASKFCSH